MKQTGIRDPMVGEVTAVRVVCLRPGCGWEHTGNQMTAFIAEYRHWQSHVPDKKQQKAKRMHQAVDGPHYAAVEGQPSPGVTPSQGSLTQLPFLFLNVGQGLTLLVGENNGVCHLSLIEKFGDWLSTDQEPLFSSQVSGPPCQKLWEAVKKDNETRLGK
jgi:hypothetical protein